MTDDLENLLQRFHPADPPDRLREKIANLKPQYATTLRCWPVHLFRGAIAAMLLISFCLLYASTRLNNDSAAHVGIGVPRWTAEAQQAADLIGPGPAAREYIAVCLLAGNARPSTNLVAQGEDR